MDFLVLPIKNPKKLQTINAEYYGPERNVAYEDSTLVFASSGCRGSACKILIDKNLRGTFRFNLFDRFIR